MHIPRARAGQTCVEGGLSTSLAWMSSVWYMLMKKHRASGEFRSMSCCKSTSLRRTVSSRNEMIFSLFTIAKQRVYEDKEGNE